MSDGAHVRSPPFDGPPRILLTKMPPYSSIPTRFGRHRLRDPVVHTAAIVGQRLNWVTVIEQLADRPRGLRALWAVAEQDRHAPAVELILAVKHLVVRNVHRSCDRASTEGAGGAAVDDERALPDHVDQLELTDGAHPRRSLERLHLTPSGVNGDDVGLAVDRPRHAAWFRVRGPFSTLHLSSAPVKPWIIPAGGNVVDLAVAVVIGAAFAKVVGGLLQGVINPLIASVAGKPNLDSIGTFTLNQANFSIGLLLTPLVNFVCVGAGIYVMVVMPLNKLAERRARGVEPKTEAPSEEVALPTEIRDSMQVRSRAQW